MGSKLDRSTKIQLWIVFGLFIGIILGMIGYEVNKVYQSQKQRENFEKIRKFEVKHINKEKQEQSAVKDTTINKEEPPAPESAP
jgi:hypothetical protein